MMLRTAKISELACCEKFDVSGSGASEFSVCESF